jgi:probable rRNA maturation factor
MRGFEINLLILNESSHGKPPLGTRAMHRCLREAFRRGGLPGGAYEVSLFLIDDAEMRELNARHRGLSRTTDVLSFPQFDVIEDIMPGPDGRAALGDIAISLQALARRCANRGDDSAVEFARILIHGVLHLIGYEHRSRPAREAMRRLERRVVDTIFR